MTLGTFAEGAFRHGAMGCCTGIVVPDPERYAQLVDALLAFIDLSGALGKTPHRSDTERRRLASLIDRLAGDGTPWPNLGPVVDHKPLLPRDRTVGRAQTRRPVRGYCVRWNGSFWAPCFSQAERRAAGHVGLIMCWPPPIPKTGEYIVSGNRARFAYRVAEVERFRPPRGTKRYTCRLWCERVDPEIVPRRARVHAFYWHPRGQKPAR